MSGRGLLSSFGGFLSRSQAERDLQVARRLGYWFTEEDRQLLREREVQQALVRRAAVLNQAARVGTVGVLLAAWAVPPLWPLAVVASFRVFPRTSRCLLFALVGVTGATLVGSAVVVHQVLESNSPPPAALPAARPADPPAGP